MATTAKNVKYVYSFGGGKADGNESMKNLLGGKGANLAEMAGHKDLKLPVPPGFTITTDVCTYFYANKRQYPTILEKEIKDALAQVEKLMGKKKFNEILGALVDKPKGNLTLVPDSDKRRAITLVNAEFQIEE